MRVLIIGGGIGGLAAAVALRKVGIEASVVERFDTIREVGAGLSIWSNAVNALRQLGVEDKVLSAASVVERTSTRTSNGRILAVNDFSDLSREASAPSICIHRAALQRILFEELSADVVRTGAQCAGFEGTSAILENGERIDADVLVGADGISSVVREGLHGNTRVRYGGYTCWRGICPDTGVLEDRATILAIGKGSQFGLWPCGKGRLYWFLTGNAPRGTNQGKAGAVELCRDWAAPVPEVIDATPTNAILQNDIVDRPPLRWWGRGRVTLLGDAAHATTPNLGQGACQALEDAVVLAHCLKRGGNTEEALREYERLRIPRTTSVVLDSWRSGRMFHATLPVLTWFRNRLLRSSLGDRIGKQMLRKLLTYRVPEL